MYYWVAKLGGIDGPRFLYRKTASEAATSFENIWPNNPVLVLERCAELSFDPSPDFAPCGCGGVGSRHCAEEIANAPA